MVDKELMRNRWSVFEFFTQGLSYVITKLFFPRAKLVLFPLYLRGKKSLKYGKDLNLGYGCRFDLLNPSKVTLIIGENCEMGDYCHIVAIDSVKIGDNFLGASKIFISDCSHGDYSDSETCSLPSQPPRKRDLISSPVVIGNNVWIGDNVVILRGVTIGDGCVVGANSVVTHNVENNTIVAGIPARPIKKYNKYSKVWENVNG